MPRSYVDNAMNRSLGRVGMAVGSMPVSKGSSYGGGGGGYSSSSRTDSGYSGSTSSYSSKTYVDNAMNRSVGRVGMPVGSMPVSASSSSAYASTSHSRNDSLNDSVFSRSSSSSDTYVDNAKNRSLGRVGLPLGSMPASRDSSSSADRHASLNDSVFSSSSSAADTYVDNAKNRSLGRVGMPKGSMPESRSSNSTGDKTQSRYDSSCSKSYSSDTYVDNTYNRKLGRVGLPKGLAVSHQDTYTQEKVRTSTSDSKTYVDNAFNRKLGRVGLPLGSKEVSKGSVGSVSQTKSLKSETIKVYKDNDMNRRLGRAGKPLGSMPIGKKSASTKKTRELIEKMQRDEEWCPEENYSDSAEQLDDSVGLAIHLARYYFNRLSEEKTWKKEKRPENQPKTTPKVLEEYKGKAIPFEELELGSQIGSGGFGDVYFAKWDGSIVAVKKLKAGTVSKRRLNDFVKEVMLFCKLDHENVVKFVGACIERPDLCIVMEYMQMSLFEAIHIRNDYEFTEAERLHIIKQVCNGLKYLHNLDIAHRDLKSSNVLINYQEGDIDVKITDFGLSSMKGNIESSSSYRGEIVGTPRYSAPEILRGDRGHSVEDHKKADIYSLALVMFEVVFEEEPFYDYSLQQLIKYVGKYGVSPEVPDTPAADEDIVEVIKMAWSFQPEDRPQIAQLCDEIKTLKTIYAA